MMPGDHTGMTCAASSYSAQARKPGGTSDQLRLSRYQLVNQPRRSGNTVSQASAIFSVGGRVLPAAPLEGELTILRDRIEHRLLAEEAQT